MNTLQRVAALVTLAVASHLQAAEIDLTFSPATIVSGVPAEVRVTVRNTAKEPITLPPSVFLAVTRLGNL